MSTNLTPCEQFIQDLKKSGLIQGKDFKFFVNSDNRFNIRLYSNGAETLHYLVDEQGNGRVYEEHNGMFNRFPCEGGSECSVIGFKKDGWESFYPDYSDFPRSPRAMNCTLGVLWKNGEQVSAKPERISEKLDKKTGYIVIKVLARQR